MVAVALRVLEHGAEVDARDDFLRPVQERTKGGSPVIFAYSCTIVLEIRTAQHEYMCGGGGSCGCMCAHWNEREFRTLTRINHPILPRYV